MFLLAMGRTANDFSEYFDVGEHFPNTFNPLNDLHEYHVENYGENHLYYGKEDDAKWLSGDFLEKASDNDMDNLVVGLGPFFDFVGGKARYMKLEEPTESQVSRLEDLIGEDELGRCSRISGGERVIEDLVTPADAFKAMSLAENTGKDVYYPDTVPSYIDDPELGLSENWYKLTRDPMIEDLENSFTELEIERDAYPDTDHNELLLQKAGALNGETALLTFSEGSLHQSQEYGDELVVQQPKLTWQIIENQ